MGSVWPRMLTQREIHACLVLEFIVVTDENHQLDESVISRLFSEVDVLTPFGSSGGVGDPRDYSPEQIAALTTAVRKIRTHAFN